MTTVTRQYPLLCNVALLLAALFGFSTTIGAMAAGKEGSPLDETDIPEFKLVESPDVSNGKVGFATGTTSPGGVNLKLPGLWITQPVQIVLIEGKRGNRLQLELRKYHWAAPLRTASTGNDGKASEIFRTQGDLYIRVSSSQGEQPYQLLVWVGEEIEPVMEPVIVPRTKGREVE